jgi:hypothetical protein
MAKRTAKLTNYETGETRIVETTQGHLMAAQHKLPNQTMFVSSTLMVYLAANPAAMRMSGEKLFDAAAEYFTQWDFEDITDKEDDKEDDPLVEEGSPEE